LSLRKFEGLRFRRQNPIGRYIADFYCHELKLIIEIDGEIHSKQRQYDKNRDAYLAACGYITMRFTDREIIENVDGVLNRIRSAIKSK
jgi:very-short-patch-repair endonuclease